MLFLIIVAVFATNLSFATEKASYVSLEAGLTWQSKNDQRIPGKSGTTFSLSDFDKGPFKTYRLYVGKKFKNKHELRLLYAPLELDLKGQFDRPVTFIGRTFAGGVPTSAFYKFNSYRLTYAYHLDKVGEWELAYGVTGKIREAEVRLTQGSMTEKKTNVGFVPLFHFQAYRAFLQDWALQFDFDGLAAPQGRAFDVALVIEHSFFSSDLKVFGGYRTLEGGADNDTVYNFAWFHTALAGIKGYF